MTGRGFLDTLASSLASLFESLIEQVFGTGVHKPVFGDISWANLGVLFCFILLVFAVRGLADAFLRRKIRLAQAHPASREWHMQFWQAVGPPLHLLTWIYGLYFAAAPLLLKLSVAHDPDSVRGLFDRLFDVGVFVALFWLLFKFTHVIEAGLKAWSGRTDSNLDDLVVPLLGRSLRVIVPVLGIVFAMPLLGLAPESANMLGKASSILIIAAVAYVLFQAIALGEKAVVAHYDIDAADNLQARKVYTQVHVLSKMLYIIVGIFTVASMLMLFDEVRRFGTSILASAGVVGIIIGIAAQRTIANLFAGFQLAMTQPIRLDDVVIVEGEWGRIEEVTLTYVVVQIWDDRRLIVPLSYFIEKPFENWTRKSADILGSVFIWADYSLPIAQLRPAIEGIVKGCKDWDQRFWNLQVTDTTDRAMQLRVLATAADASKAWDLRCEIREKLLDHIQRSYPGYLPKARATLDPAFSLREA